MMIDKVLPSSWLISPSTFSNRKPYGCFSFRMRSISKKSVPRVSSNPSPNPAAENG